MVATVFDLFAIRTDATDYAEEFRSLIQISPFDVVNTTGSITVGVDPNLLTVASATGLRIGQRIAIEDAVSAGVELVTRIIAIDGTDVTLQAAASGTVVDARVLAINTDSFSVMDFGATADGTTDNHSAISTADAAGLELRFPPGQYKISSNLTITNKCIMEEGARFVIPTGVKITFTNGVTASPRQHIFSVTGSGRAILPHQYSLMWFGALADDATDAGPALQAAINSCADAATGGHAAGSGVIFCPKGTFRFTTAVTYVGDSGHGLVITGETDTGTYRGANVATQFNWYGTATTFIRWEGANGSTFKDIKLVSYAQATCEKIVWVDAINGDVGSSGDSGSSGVRFLNVYITAQNDCLAETAALAIGHLHGVGASTSQVSEINCHTLYCVGPGTGNGIGIDVLEAGNTKVFSFRRALVTHWDIGIRWLGSSYMYLTDSSCGNNNLDIKQIGGGQLHVNAFNSEASHQFLIQVAGTGACNATIRTAEWAGYENTGGGLDIIGVRGYVELDDVVLRADGALYADSIPWIAFHNLPTYDVANHSALILKGVSFGAVYLDGDSVHRLPVRDGSGNVITEPTGDYTSQRTAFWAWGCTSLERFTDPVKLDYDRPFVRVGAMSQNQRDDVAAVNGDMLYNSTTKRFQGYGNDTYGNIVVSSEPVDVINLKVADLANYYCGKYVGRVVRITDEVDGPCLAIAKPRGWVKLIDETALVAGDPYDVLIESSIIYWDCQEASGDLVDAHLALAAVATGTPTYQAAGPTAWLPYGVATSLGNYFATAGDVELANVLVNDFSLACWVYPTRTNTYECIVGKANNANGSQFRFFNNNGYTKLFRGLDSETYSAQKALTANQWQFVAVGRDSTNGLSFASVDGVRDEFDENQAGFTGSAQNWSNSQPIRIGSDGLNPYTYIGRISGIAIFNKVLTDEDIDVLIAGPGA